MRGVHSEWAYKTLEAANDAVIDFRIKEVNDETRSLIRIRSMRTVHFDSRWHRLEIGENFEVFLEK